jgi:3-oxoacyl-[acyl-carrier-protein] synthase III
VRAGVLGIGTYLPPTLRGNDWWPQAVVDEWRGLPRPSMPDVRMTPAMERVVGAMREAGADPFRGIRARHVIDDAMTSTDMEAIAAETAITNARIDRAQIDLLLVHTAVPEYLLSNTASALHHRLGLPRACFSLEAQASAYSFVAQLALAEAMILAGRAHVALLVQSSAASRLLDAGDPVSVALGDAATAVVVGEVDDEHGIIAHVSRTDGRCPNSLIASVRDRRWYDEGRNILYVHDAAGEHQLFLETVDRGIEVIGAVLEATGTRPQDIDFFAVHQGTPWLRRLTQEACGLTGARTVDLFSQTAYVFAASLPLVLASGRDAGLLRDGDRVLVFGGGTGITYGATLMRWNVR